MILLTAGKTAERDFDALLLFARMLSDQGHQVAIDARSVGFELRKHHKYEAAPYLCEPSEAEISRVIVLSGDGVSEETQLLLRSLHLQADVPVHVLGRFPSYQDGLTAMNRVAFATGQPPELINLADAQTAPLLEAAIGPLLAHVGSDPTQTDAGPVSTLLYLNQDALEAKPNILPALGALSHHADVDLHVLTNAQGKELIRRSTYSMLSVFSYAELPPATVAGMMDVLAVFGGNVPGERVAQLAINMLGAGKVVIDCTENSAFEATGAPVIRGHADPAGFENHLISAVLPNRLEIGRRAQLSDWIKGYSLSDLAMRLRLDTPDAAKAPPKGKTLFFPTNGNGLGHAQRCALVAEALPKGAATAQFAAFPSCVDMLQSRGFPTLPMAQRTAEHSQEYANDLLNYLRLKQTLHAGDQLVFDGGYVFDSVYRAVSELNLSATWIRRGLWQASQVHPTALERERVFDRVIVPHEAFPELNSDYSGGGKLHHVGPIVNTQRIDAGERQNIRDGLAERFGRAPSKLVVSMLGGGMASDRASQLHMLSALMDAREDALHLVVAWPNAVIDNGLYAWKNTEVVSTKHAARLAQAADLVISAAGYNSFHEMLYAQVPAIFIPQHAPYLDDQESRARAAADRDAATLVLEHELLLLEREVAAHLDGDKADTVRAALAKLALPEPGNSEAARIIAEGGPR